MAILEFSENTAPEYSIAQKQDFTKNMLLNRTRQSFLNLKDAYVEAFTIMTKNPYGLTLIEVLEGLGQEGVELHRLGSITVRALNEALPGVIPVEMTMDLPDPSTFVTSPSAAPSGPSGTHTATPSGSP